MRPTDVAVLEREQRRVGMPRFVPFVHGYDFGVAYAHPMDGASGAPAAASHEPGSTACCCYTRSAMSAWLTHHPSRTHHRTTTGPAPSSTTPALAAFARQALSDAPLPPGAGGVRAEQLHEPPRAIADRVLRRVGDVQSDIGVLATAQRAASSAARHGDTAGLATHLDAAFAAAARCDEWRRQVASAVAGGAGGSGSDAGNPAASASTGSSPSRWQCLTSDQMSKMLSLADQINAVLDSWQRCSRGELWRALGLDVRTPSEGGAGGAAHLQNSGSSGSNRAGPAAAAAAAAAAGAASAAAVATAPALGTLVDMGSSSSDRPTYLDLLTGDTFNTNSAANPFFGSGAAASQQQGPLSSVASVNSTNPFADGVGGPSCGPPEPAPASSQQAPVSRPIVLSPPPANPEQSPSSAAGAGSTGGSSDAGGAAGDSAAPVNPFAGAALPAPIAAAAAEAAAAKAAAATAAAGRPTSPATIETRVLDLFGEEEDEARSRQHAATASASSSMDEEARLRQQQHAPAAAAPLPPALRQRLHAVVAARGRGAPALQELLPALERLLAEVAAEHAGQLAAAEAAHRAEVAEIKATAVRRLKEVMQGQQGQREPSGGW
jgi:hypothetical protein